MFIGNSGRETPVARWCPSPSPMDPYWGYYPPDPYAYYNYISDLNAAYGYPPPPPPPPPFIPQRFPGYLSDNDENGYSSTDELGQYYSNYRRNMGYPFPENFQQPTPKPQEVPEPEEDEEEQEEESEEESTDESVSSSEEETDTDDTEIEEEGAKKLRKSSAKIKTLKSVSDVKIYTSESTATVTNDEWEDCESKLGDEDQEEVEEAESEEEEEEEMAVEVIPEEIIPHQLSVIFEESEASDVESLRRAAQSIASETDSTATLDVLDEEDESENEDDLVSQSSVTVRLPLKFSRDDEVTTVTVGDSEEIEESKEEIEEPKEDIEECKKKNEDDEYKSDEADVSFTFSIPTRSNSVVTVLSTEDELKSKSVVEVIEEELNEAETEVTVSVSLPKKRDEKTAESVGDLETDKTEPGSYEKSVGKLEEMISSILETTHEQKRKLNKKDSSVDESEEDDSGVTSDMSNKLQNSETDTESEYSELNKMTQYQRASTHSRLFKLLQDECEKDTDDEEDDSKSDASPVCLESLTARKEKLTLPLNSPEAESQSSSSGVTSPSSPTVTDRLVKELIQSLLHKKKGKKFRKLPMAKLHAAALRILQEDMDPYDTSSASASGDDGFMMSPVRKPHSLPEPPPAENIYGENYNDYLDYYNSWAPPQGYYAPPDYDILPSRAFQYLNHPGSYSPGFKPKCPRIPLPPNYPPPQIREPTPTFQRSPDELSLSFTDKRERVAKVLDKGKNPILP